MTEIPPLSEMNEDRNSLEAESRSLLTLTHWRLAAGVMLLVFVVIFSAYRWLAETAPAPLTIVFNEQAITLSSGDAIRLLKDVEARLLEQETTLQAYLADWEEETLEALSLSFHTASEGFLDWYFSPVGSYSRLVVALVGDMDTWLLEQVQQRLVMPAGLDDHWQTRLAEHGLLVERTQEEWLRENLSDIHSRYAQHRLTDTAADGEPAITLDLGALAGEAWQAHSDAPRWISAASTGGVTLGSWLIARVVNGATAKVVKATVSRFAARLMAHGARSAAVGTGTAAASGPAAPLTAPIAVGVSLAVAVSSEYGILKFEEMRYRPAMEQELAEAWVDLEQTVRERFKANVQTQSDQLKEKIQASARARETELPPAYRILGG